jgi:D-amino-acid dehydrogenase
MHVMVLGAGVIGTTSAWFLRKAGHDVSVIERQPQAATETSFANGGQISVSHAEPWANPSAPFKVLRWLFQNDAPLLFRPRFDPAQWRWCLGFLMECRPCRTRDNIAKIVELGLYSRRVLGETRAELDLHYDDLQRGILHFYTSQDEYDAAVAPAALMRKLGCDLEMVDRERMLAIEPALRFTNANIVGGSMTYADESGDACAFTRKLAEKAAERGVDFKYGTTVVGIDTARGRVSGVQVRTRDGSHRRLAADAYVVALGSYSAGWMQPLGVDLNIYPAKGYSATVPVRDPSRAYTVSLTDDEYKLVFSRLGDRLRIAGTAELSGYNLALNEARCQALVRRTLEIFPDVADPEKAQFWTGLRPATPSNVPYIGRSKLRNLYLNTGHGTLGWTHSCGSGRVLADIVSGKRPEVSWAEAA